MAGAESVVTVRVRTDDGANFSELPFAEAAIAKGLRWHVFARRPCFPPLPATATSFASLSDAVANAKGHTTAGGSSLVALGTPLHLVAPPAPAQLGVSALSEAAAAAVAGATTVAASPDNPPSLLAAAFDSRVLLINAETGAIRKTLHSESAQVTRVAFNPVHHWIVYGGESSFEVFDLVSRATLFQYHLRSPISDIQHSSEGDRCTVTDSAGNVIVINCEMPDGGVGIHAP